MRRHLLATISTLTLAFLLVPAPRLAAGSDDSDLLAVRRTAWVAWFGGDRATLEKLLPRDGLFVGSGSEALFTTAAQTLESSRKFREGGGRLVRLDFPVTEVRRYGDTALLFTTYEMELESSGARSLQKGKGVEVFVRQDGRWLHPTWCLIKDAAASAPEALPPGPPGPNASAAPEAPSPGPPGPNASAAPSAGPSGPNAPANGTN